MTISKEIFGIERKEVTLREDVMMQADYKDGFNDCIDLIDQFELSEEEIEEIMQFEFFSLNIKTMDSHDARLIKAYSKAIIQNKAKIFVRKTE